ncbi:hypothetical protein H4R35_006394 [Dimargaris xerosporica]|nr:hypothetical protein H4R35_006394 [Dimargaris xerosporica]
MGSASSDIDVAMVVNLVKEFQYSKAIDPIRGRHCELLENSTQAAICGAHRASFNKFEAMMHQAQLQTILAYILHIALDASSRGIQTAEDFIAEMIGALEAMRDSRFSDQLGQALYVISMSDLEATLNPPQNYAYV